MCEDEQIRKKKQRAHEYHSIHSLSHVDINNRCGIEILYDNFFHSFWFLFCFFSNTNIKEIFDASNFRTNEDLSLFDQTFLLSFLSLSPFLPQAIVHFFFSSLAPNPLILCLQEHNIFHTSRCSN